jgi:hypothetical protein
MSAPLTRLTQISQLIVTRVGTENWTQIGRTTISGFTIKLYPHLLLPRVTFKTAAAVGNAPTYQVLQTRANLSQLNSESIGMAGLELAISCSQSRRLNRWATSRKNGPPARYCPLFYRLSTDCITLLLQEERACFCPENLRRPWLCRSFVITLKHTIGAHCKEAYRIY